MTHPCVMIDDGLVFVVMMRRMRRMRRMTMMMMMMMINTIRMLLHHHTTLHYQNSVEHSPSSSPSKCLMLSYINAVKFLDDVITLMGWKKKHTAGQRTVLKGD